MDIYLIIILVALAVFFIRTLIFFIGCTLERRHKTPGFKAKDLPYVSVIIPARNEENNISSCLLSISNNSYPKDKVEIIVVNDRSTDNTLFILNELQKKYTNLKIINISQDNSHSNLKGKAGAVHQGICNSNGSIILMTDADCIVNPKWIESVVDGYSEDNVGLIASYTIIDGKNFFERLQCLEWVYNHTLACGGIGIKQPLGCFGNNLSVRKNCYIALGGYEKIKFSVTEDLALLQAVFDSKYKVRYICSEGTTITTLPVKTIKEYISQHARWAIGGLELGWRAAFFVVSSAALWAGFVAACLIPDPFWIITIILARFLGDYFIVRTALEAMNKINLRRWLAPAVFFYMLVELIVPFLLLKKEIKWKDQIFLKS